MKVQVTIKELTAEDLVDLFSTALYGSNIFGADYGNADAQGVCFEDKLADTLLKGGHIYIHDLLADGDHFGNLPYEVNDDDTVSYTVTLEDMLRGLDAAANGTWTKSKTDAEGVSKCFHTYMNREVDYDWDYTRASVLLQIIVFGELIY